MSENFTKRQYLNLNFDEVATVFRITDKCAIVGSIPLHDKCLYSPYRDIFTD